MSQESISLALSELKAFFTLHSAPRLNLCVLLKQVCKKQNQTRNELKFLFFSLWNLAAVCGGAKACFGLY